MKAHLPWGTEYQDGDGGCQKRRWEKDLSSDQDSEFNENPKEDTLPEA